MKGHHRRFWYFLIAGLLVAAVAQAQDPSQKILVSHAWVRAMPPSMKSTAAYLTIENTTGAELVLQSAGTAVARTVEIHRMEQVGEVMKMKAVGELRIPGSGKAVLAPKGYHLMLIDLLRPLQEGETIALVLNFSDGTTVNFDAVVSKWGTDVSQ
jgi:copper(I)-binding protein